MPNNDALERLEKKLASSAPDGIRRSSFPGRRGGAPRDWQKWPEEKRRRSPGRFGPLEWFFAASVAFFIVASGISALLFLSGNNTVSTKNVDIIVSGPTEIGAGETLPLQIVITNRNAVPMQLADLILEFPDGTRSDADIAIELPRVRESLGTIEPGESINRTVRAVVFGEAGSDITVKASVEYRVPSSNAVFVDEASYIAKINKSPASIVVDAFKEAVSGQNVSLSVSVSSNAPEVLKNILLIAEYPPGFSFISSEPAPVSGSASWSLGDIEPGGKRSVTLHGVFTGEDGDERVLRFSAGSKRAGRDDMITAPLATSNVTIAITKPFLSAALALGGSVSPEQTITRGEAVRGDIRWTNNLPVRAEDVEIELAIHGNILDRSRVNGEQGFFRSGNQTIVWSSETLPRFANVPPGDSGVVSFTFATLPPSSGFFRNPELTFAVTVRARRLSESNVPETVQSTALTHAVVVTDLSLRADLARSSIFAESGPVPPKADTETTYTVVWTVVNSSNAVANAAVSAVVPSYVRWIGATSPANEPVSYNPVGGIVTWNIGDLSENGQKTLAFQIGITPSLSQVGSVPSLITNQRVSGFDRFARVTVEETALTLTTASLPGQKGDVVP